MGGKFGALRFVTSAVDYVHHSFKTVGIAENTAAEALIVEPWWTRLAKRKPTSLPIIGQIHHPIQLVLSTKHPFYLVWVIEARRCGASFNVTLPGWYFGLRPCPF